MLVGGPIVPLLLTWVGGYDAIAVIAATVAALSRRTWVMAAGWAVLSFNHSSIAIVMLILWLPMMWVVAPTVPRRERIERGLWAAAAVLAGWFAIRTLADGWGGSTDRLALFQTIGMGSIWPAFLASLPIVLFTVLGVGWLVVLAPGVRSTVPGRLLLVEAAVAGLLLPLIAVDETRIAALAVLASMLTFVANMEIVGHPLELDRIGRQLWLVAVIVPVPIVWEGALLYIGWGRFGDFLAVFG